MKVFAVLVALCSLVAFSEANAIPKDNGKSCCLTTDIDGKPLKEPMICMTFKELVALREKEISEAIDQTPGIKRTAELELQIKINAIQKAAARCDPNVHGYYNAHITLEELHTIIDKFPSPKNVRKKINTAQEVLEELFNKVRIAQTEAGPNLPQKVNDQINNFIKESVKKAVKIFKHNADRSSVNRKVFDEVNLTPEIEKIVEKMDSCMELDRTDYEATFKCHDEMRLLATELSEKMLPMRGMAKLNLILPEDSIERLLINVTTEEKSLEEMLRNHKLSEDMIRNYKGFMP